MSVDDVPEFVLAKQLKEAGFPQQPGIVIGGIDGELKIGRYLVCRVEGECGVCILRDDEYQKYIEANDPRNYIVKLPFLEELIRECENWWWKNGPDGMPQIHFAFIHSQVEKSGGWRATLGSEGYFRKEKPELIDDLVGFAELGTPEEAAERLWLALNKKA